GEESEGPCLISPLSVCTTMFESTSGPVPGLLEVPCQAIALTQPGHPQCLVDRADGGAVLHRLLQQCQSLGDPPGQGIGHTQVCGYLVQPGHDVPDAREFQAALQHDDGLVDVPFAQVEAAHPVVGRDAAVGMIG